MAHKRRTLPAEVVKAQADFEHWPTHHQGNEPIPDELWQVAAAEAHHHGLTLVSRVLRLNCTKLKQCLLAQQPPAPVMSRKTQQVPAPKFTEYSPLDLLGDTCSNAGVRVVLRKPGGEGLVVALEPHHPLDIEAPVTRL